jgi:hypothetical protein
MIGSLSSLQRYFSTDWTIEFFFYPTEEGLGDSIISCLNDGLSLQTLELIYARSTGGSSNYVRLLMSDSAGAGSWPIDNTIYSSSAVALNTWSHIAIVCNNQYTFSMYVAGKFQSSATMTSIATLASSTSWLNYMCIGSLYKNNTMTQEQRIYVSNLRFSNYARYTGTSTTTTNFTLPTENLTADSYTVFLNTFDTAASSVTTDSLAATHTSINNTFSTYGIASTGDITTSGRITLYGTSGILSYGDITTISGGVNVLGTNTLITTSGIYSILDGGSFTTSGLLTTSGVESLGPITTSGVLTSAGILTTTSGIQSIGPISTSGALSVYSNDGIVSVGQITTSGSMSVMGGGITTISGIVSRGSITTSGDVYTSSGIICFGPITTSGTLTAAGKITSGSSTTSGDIKASSASLSLISIQTVFYAQDFPTNNEAFYVMQGNASTTTYTNPPESIFKACTGLTTVSNTGTRTGFSLLYNRSYGAGFSMSNSVPGSFVCTITGLYHFNFYARWTDANPALDIKYGVKILYGSSTTSYNAIPVYDYQYTTNDSASNTSNRRNNNLSMNIYITAGQMVWPVSYRSVTTNGMLEMHFNGYLISM